MSEQFITNVNEKNLILTRAQGAVIARDFQTASRLYKQLLRDDPSNVDYLKELGSIYVKNNEDEKAIPYYEQIITFYPHYIEAMNSLGAIFRRLKRYEDSIQILQRALDEGRQTATVNYNLGFTYKEMGDFDDAIDAFTAVINENPSDVLAYNHMGSIYYTQKAYEKAINSFRKGLQVDPNHPILNYNLARCYRDAKMTNDAIRCFEKTLRVKPGWVDAIKDFSELLIKVQNTKEASELVQRSIQLHPNDAKLLGLLGRIYLDQFDYDSAEKTFKRARNINGKDIEILQGLAKVLEKKDKPQEALEAVNTALELEPENKDLLKQYVYTLLSAEDYAQAHDNVQNLYEDAGQHDPQVLDLYGQYYICTDQESNAEKCFSEIEKTNRHYKNHILSAANRYDQVGQTQKAVEKAKEFVARDSGNPEGYNTLGKIYQKTGDLQGAFESYSKSKKLIKPNVLADKQLSKLEGMMEKLPEEEKPEVTAPVEEPKEDVIAPAAPVVEDKAEEEFDFGTMGDNVPMGEALLEQEKDFFDKMDDELEQEAAEEIEEEEEPDEPIPTYSEYSKPAGNMADKLEDEGLSPFENPYEEPKSTSEQLVPDADFSGDGKNSVSDDEILDSMINDPVKEPASAYEPAAATEPATATEPAATAESSSAPDSPYSSAYEPADGGFMGGAPAENPYASSAAAPSNDGNSGFEQQQYESSMNQFANEMQKRMQDAMMDSAKFAMDSAMNAQRMAQQIAEEQEKLKNRIDNMPQPQEYEPAVQPSAASQVNEQENEEPSIFDDLFVEPEPEQEQTQTVESGVVSTGLGQIQGDEPISAELEPVGETLNDDDWNSTFMNTDDVLQEINGEPEGEYVEMNCNKEVAPETVTEAAEGVPVNEVLEETPEGKYVEATYSKDPASQMLPGISKILEDDNLANLNASEVELFKKFLTFREFMGEEERAAFDSGKIRMLLEYIIARMSGKPGLLKTAQSLIKSGLLGSDFESAENDADSLELSNELIKRVLNIMICLAEDLEDKGLTQALKNCAEAVLEKIELEEGKFQIFC